MKNLLTTLGLSALLFSGCASSKIDNSYSNLIQKKINIGIPLTVCDIGILGEDLIFSAEKNKDYFLKESFKDIYGDGSTYVLIRNYDKLHDKNLSAYFFVGSKKNANFARDEAFIIEVKDKKGILKSKHYIINIDFKEEKKGNVDFMDKTIDRHLNKRDLYKLIKIEDEIQK